MTAVLSGLRVVEISTGLPGALTGMYLADQGADVIRVESPEGPRDDTHPVWDRGKRSIRLDLSPTSGPSPSSPGAGREAFDRLLDTADVFLTSVSPATTQRLGLDATTVAIGRPRLVHCMITGYGHDPGACERPGYDALVAARHGLQWDQPSYRRNETGQFLDGAPVFLHLPLPSYGAAFLAVTGIAAALFARARGAGSGGGRLVETSLAQGAMLFTTMWRVRAQNEPEHFQLLPRTARGSVFECADGAWVHVMPLGDSPARTFQVLEVAVEGPVTAGTLMAPDPATERALRAGFRRFTRPDLLRRFAEASIPAVAVQSTRDMYAHPQLLHNAMVIEVDDPELGRTRQTGIPFVLERNPASTPTGRPRPGEHTREILAELGL